VVDFGADLLLGSRDSRQSLRGPFEAFESGRCIRRIVRSDCYGLDDVMCSSNTEHMPELEVRDILVKGRASQVMS
jgi:hypothetical protein